MLKINGQKLFTYLIISAIILLYIVLDEEPFADLTDASLLQIIILTISILILLSENFIKFFYGQGLLSDKNLFVFAYYYLNNTYLYFLIIWGVFYCHHITPLNMSNVDLNGYVINNMYTSTSNFHTAAFSIVLHLYVMTLNLNKVLNQKQILLIISTTLVCVYVLILSITDLLTTSITSSDKVQFKSLKFNNKFSLTYSNADSLGGFEWHLSESRVQSISLLNSMSIFGSIFIISYILIFIYIISAFLINQLFNKFNYKLINMQVVFITELYKNMLLFSTYAYIFIFVYSMFIYIFVNNML